MTDTDAMKLDDLDLPAFDRVSVARVATDRPARYGHQLVSHMSRKITGAWDKEAGRGFLSFDRDRVSGGVLEVTCQEADGGAGERGSGPALVLTLRSSQEGLERLEEVVGIHLARFGWKDGMVVAWERLVPGTGGAWGTEQGAGASRVPGSRQGPLSEADMERMRREHEARRAQSADSGETR